MSSSLIRGKYVIGRVINNDPADVIEDGAVSQREGKIVEIGLWNGFRCPVPVRSLMRASQNRLCRGPARRTATRP